MGGRTGVCPGSRTPGNTSPQDDGSQRPVEKQVAPSSCAPASSSVQSTFLRPLLPCPTAHCGCTADTWLEVHLGHESHALRLPLPEAAVPPRGHDCRYLPCLLRSCFLTGRKLSWNPGVFLLAPIQGNGSADADGLSRRARPQSGWGTLSILSPSTPGADFDFSPLEVVFRFACVKGC